MTPRERIIATFRHRMPDRISTDGWFHPEVCRRVMDYLGVAVWGDALCELGIEGWAAMTPVLKSSEFEARAVTRSVGTLTRTGIWRDDRTYEDAWGVARRIGEAGWYEEWMDGPLRGDDGDDPAALDRIRWLTPRNCDDPPDYAASVRAAQDRGEFVRATLANPFRTAWELRGMDNVLMDYLVNPAYLEALYDRLYALIAEQARRAVLAGVDMISIIGDVAMQDRIMMGPESWRAFDKPRLAKLVADCRRLNPDVFFFIHSDGNLTDLMDDLVEIGFDVINPIQPECMDPAEVKRRWGDRITLHGGVSLQRALPNGTPDDVRAEIHALIRACGHNGGLVVFPSNVLQPDTSAANIVALFHAARDFDLSTLPA